MNQADYKKKYEQLKGFVNDLYPHMSDYCKEKIGGYFHKSAESEDERIMKNIITFLDELFSLGKNTNFDKWSKSDCAEWIAWLEKQGEQSYWKPSEEQMQTLHAQLNEDAVTYKEDRRVLTTLYEDLLKISLLEKQGEQSDANKEYWRGYREGKQEVLDKYAEQEKQGEQKPAWSEDDEDALDIAIRIIQNGGDDCAGILDSDKALKWLKSLKDKMLLQSKQDERKPVDKVEPKFKVGDKVLWKHDKTVVRTITDVSNYGTYWIKCPCCSSGWWSEQELESYVNQDDQKSVIDPKFKVGDWVVYDAEEWWEVLMVDRVNDGIYHLVDVNGETSNALFEEECNMRLWSIGDARDGDVLSFDNECSNYHSIGIFKRMASKNELNGNTYRCYVKYGGFKEKLEIPKNGNELHHCGTSAHPATKEQRDQLFSKMKEAGYEWDADKKELKKIEQKAVEWNEDDEVKINGIMNYLCQSDAVNLEDFNEWYEWLKSLKERFTQIRQRKPMTSVVGVRQIKQIIP